MCNFVFAQKDSNSIFLSNKGKLPFPLKKSTFPEKFYNQIYRGCFQIKGSKEENYLSLFRTENEDAFAIFEGEIVMIEEMDSTSFILMTQFEDYFIAYGGITKPIFKVGDFVKKGEKIASLSRNIDFVFRLDLFISKGLKDLDPKEWLLPIK